MSIPKVAPDKHPETEDNRSNSTLNWLRAAVLGANDGIVSISGLVVGVAGVTNSQAIILTTGMAGLIAGAISMAVGEFVSVSSQRDSEKALLAKEKWELKHFPEEEFEELIGLYEAKGMSRKTATVVAKELTAHDVFAAHVDVELGGINPNELTNPWHAAYASALSFLAGAVIPILAIILPPVSWRVTVTFASVVLALTLTGIISSKVSGGHAGRATLRIVIGGILAMVVTFSIGKLSGVSGI